MKLRQFKNENGITLVELLAALALFGLVIALSSSVIMQMMGSENKTSASISLRQEANVLLNELRGQFYDGKKELCFSSNKNVQIKDSQITNGEEKQLSNKGCIANIDNNIPMEISITFTDSKREQELLLETAWEGREDYVLQLEEDDDSSTLACVVNGSITLNHKVKLMKDVCPNDTYIVTGALVSNNLFFLQHDGVILKVGGSATFNHNIDLAKNSKLIIGGAAQFNQRVKLKKNSLVDIGGDATFNEIDQHKDAVIKVNGRPYKP